MQIKNYSILLHSHYIKLQDKVGNLVEYSNPNLPITDSFQIATSPPAADLKVNGVDSPPSMPYDTIFTLTWEVKNIKNCTAAGQPIKFVGGGDWTHRPNNIDINISGNAQMYARDAYTPNRNPLWIGLSCVSDAGQWVHENIYITISEGTPQTLPDLTIENVKTIPANPPVAQSFQIVFDLVNKGTVSADIYHNLSRQFLIQLEPPQEGVILTVMDLFEECNGDWIVDVEERCNITIGADINKAGAFKSSVMVDPDNKISELDEVNNRSSFMIDTIKKQDLIVKSIRFEDINEQNFIVAELCNIGESKLEVSGGLMTYFENLDTKMSSYTQDGLTLNSGMCTDSANEKKIFAEKLASQSGLYKIQVITDKSDIVSETRGDNNTLIQDIDIKVSALQCTDSDGGQNYYQKGETYDKGADQPFVDVCQDNILTEHWCGEDGRLQGGPYTCPNGCQDGACIVGETPLISIISPTAGPVGTEVSIFGQNFKENCQSKGSKVCQMSVSFNSKEIFWTTDFTNAVSWSNEKIVVRVPPGATTGPIKVYRNEIFNWGETNAYNEQYNLIGPVFMVEDPSITEIKTKAKLLHTDKYDELLAEIKELRNLVKEQDTKIRYLTKLIAGTHNLTAQIEERLNNFIAYGVDENTQKLGAGERAAVLYSYKSAFNKLPQKDSELEDAIKIANGRWPSEKNSEAEANAKKEFKKIYLRDASMSTPADNAAITVMAYGLRQKAKNRNLNSEKQGLNIFKAIYGRMPSTTEEWNTLQAITYSGAKR